MCHEPQNEQFYCFSIVSHFLLIVSFFLSTSKKMNKKIAIFIWKYILCMQTYVSVTKSQLFFCELRLGGNMNLTRFYFSFRITLHLIWIRSDGKKKWATHTKWTMIFPPFESCSIWTSKFHDKNRKKCIVVEWNVFNGASFPTCSEHIFFRTRYNEFRSPNIFRASFFLRSTNVH